MIETQLSNESYLSPSILSKAKDLESTINPIQRELIRTLLSWFFLTDNIKTKIRLQIQKKRKLINIMLLFFSIISITLEIIQCNLYLNTEIRRTKTLITIIITTNSSSTIEIIRSINSFLTAIILICAIIDYQFHKIVLIFKQHNDINSRDCTVKLLLPLIFELIIGLVHTPPFFNDFKLKLSSVSLSQTITYKLDVILFIGMCSMFKFYFVLKYLFNYSRWGDDRANKICKESNLSHNIIFVIKAELTEHPFIILLVTYGLIILVFGYSLRLCEIGFVNNVPIENYQDWTSYWNGFWCIFIAITTVGYGDFTPRTLVGRIICVIATFFGIIVFGLIIISLHTKMAMSTREIGAYKEIKITLLNKKLKTNGLKVILAYYRINRLFEKELKRR